MKLLFDENLSRNLCTKLEDLFPDSQQVCLIGLEQENDQQIWDYAKTNGYMIVSKDGDFHDLSFLYGPPPKVIWLRIGNCATKLVEQTLRDHQADIEAFATDKSTALLILEI